MKMARHKKPINLALNPELLARVEVWMKSQEAPYTKTWVFERALEEFLEARNA